jgi:hypothetical protein
MNGVQNMQVDLNIATLPFLVQPYNEGSYITEGCELEQVEGKIAGYIALGETLFSMLAELVILIRDNKLYQQAINAETGKPYATMGEYYPALMQKLRQAGHTTSEKTLREKVRLYEVFVEGLGIEPGVIDEVGVSHFTALADAADIDRKTKAIAEEARPGKLNKAEVVELIQDIQDGGWRLQDTKEQADMLRGVVQRRVELRWALVNGKARLMDMTIWEGDEAIRPNEGCNPLLAQWLDKKLSAITNLPES